MTPLLTRLRRMYGAHPLQLVLLLASFVLAGYVVHLLGVAALWNPDAWWQSIAVWFVGAALAHDLVLFPLYAAADRVLVTVFARAPRAGTRPRAVPVVNFVRVPLLACGLVSLMFFPGVIRQGAGSYNRATGQTQEPFLHRWLILCAVILLCGLVVYLVALAVAARRPPGAVTEGPVTTGPLEGGASAASPRVESTSAWAILVLMVLVGLAARRRSRRGPEAGRRA
jgi:hypothetical protein